MPIHFILTSSGHVAFWGKYVEKVAAQVIVKIAQLVAEGLGAVPVLIVLMPSPLSFIEWASALVPPTLLLRRGPAERPAQSPHPTVLVCSGSTM